MIDEEVEAANAEIAKEIEEEEEAYMEERAVEVNKVSQGERTGKLDNLLSKAAAYSTFLQGTMPDKPQELVQDEDDEEEEEDSSDSKKRKKGKRAKKAKKAKKTSEEAESALQDAASKTEGSRKQQRMEQPKLMTGGTMKNYQLDGLQWMAGLFENGLNGILADEMGLGKTIQTISLFAHIRQQGANGPLLVVAPLSTLPNWTSEIEKWLPSQQCLLYHGSKETREDLRNYRMKRHNQTKPGSFPVIITSYEIVMRDCKFLRQYDWLYIVVDEGHRLKNLNCRLIRELKTYTSANRLLLTGTPLQNNLQELWSLLNFLLPDIFDDLSMFEGWFNFDASINASDTDGLIERQQDNNIVTKLHEILRPFLLRRLKKQVDWGLPPKREVVLYAPFTDEQAYWRDLIASDSVHEELKRRNRLGGSELAKSRTLMNKVMQFRKVCNHPYLFDEPEGIPGVASQEDLVTSCGKMVLLDKLLKAMKARDSKVLIFSQMTRVLDILEDYCIMRGYKSCRIDGSVDVLERRKHMDAFNAPGSDIFVFLLSTRAGGLGINLTAADTCIIYDSDWNPHCDSQAMDRCHRIGQTKCVSVFRLITGNSVEYRMLNRANQKRKLERLVITRGNLHHRQDMTTQTKLSGSELRELMEDDVELKDGRVHAEDDEIDMVLDRQRLFADDAKFGGGEPIPPKGNGYEIVKEVVSQGILSNEQIR